jgi:hypothetical protein
MTNKRLPLARRDELDIQSVGGETLVYDKRTDKAYVLSPSAAAVWRACNGKRSVEDIANYLSRENPTTEQVVWYALGQLNDLLAEPVTVPSAYAKLSRRQFLQRAGLVGGAVAIPIVVSIVAPAPAHAQSVTVFCCVCVSGDTEEMTSCAGCLSFCESQASGEESCAEGSCPTQ